MTLKTNHSNVSYSVTIPGVPERDIELTLVYPKDATQYFYLEGKSLRLRTPIDRDPEDLASLQLEVRTQNLKITGCPNNLWIGMSQKKNLAK